MSAILVVLLSICYAVISAPASDDAQARIISYENTNDGSGNYHYSFETTNGIRKSETGTVVNPGQPDEHIEVQGEFSYLDENDTVQLVQYTADENGYRILKKPKIETQLFESFPAPMVVSEYSPAIVASLLG